MFILELLAISIVGSLMGLLGVYVGAKLVLKDDKILDVADILLTEVTENVEWQKRAYVLGGLLGQGIKSGIGIKGKSGKFKLDDLIGQIIGGFLQKSMGGLVGEQPETVTSQTPVDLNIK